MSNFRRPLDSQPALFSDPKCVSPIVCAAPRCLSGPWKSSRRLAPHATNLPVTDSRPSINESESSQKWKCTCSLNQLFRINCQMRIHCCLHVHIIIIYLQFVLGNICKATIRQTKTNVHLGPQPATTLKYSSVSSSAQNMLIKHHMIASSRILPADP